MDVALNVCVNLVVVLAVFVDVAIVVVVAGNVVIELMTNV